MLKKIASLQLRSPLKSSISARMDQKVLEPSEVIVKILSISKSSDLAKKTADSEAIYPLSESLAQFYSIRPINESSPSGHPGKGVANTRIGDLLSQLRAAQTEITQKVACLEGISALFQPESLLERELTEHYQSLKASWDEIDEISKREAKSSLELRDQIQAFQKEFLRAVEPLFKDLEAGRKVDPENFKPIFLCFETQFAKLPEAWEFSVENQRLKEKKLVEVVDRIKTRVSGDYFSRKRTLQTLKVKAQASSQSAERQTFSELRVVDEVKIIAQYNDLFKRGEKPQRVYLLGVELFKFYAIEGGETGPAAYIEQTIKGTQELKELHKTLFPKVAEIEEEAKRFDTTITSMEALDSLFKIFQGRCGEVQASYNQGQKSSEEIFKELQNVQKAFVATLLDARSSPESDQIKGALALFSPFLRYLPDFWAFDDEVAHLKALEVSKRLFEAKKTVSDKYFLRKEQLVHLLAKENEGASNRALQAIALDVQQFEVHVNEQLDNL